MFFSKYLKFSCYVFYFVTGLNVCIFQNAQLLKDALSARAIKDENDFLSEKVSLQKCIINYDYLDLCV